MNDYINEIQDLDTQRRGIRVLLDVAADPGTRRVLLEQLSVLTFRLRLFQNINRAAAMTKVDQSTGTSRWVRNR